MDAPLYGTILYCEESAGLCNQLLCIVGKLYRLHQRQRNGVLFVGSFLTEIFKTSRVPIGTIVDIQATNTELRAGDYPLRIADYSNYTLTVVSIVQDGQSVPLQNTRGDDRNFIMDASCFASASPCTVKFAIDNYEYTYTEREPQQNGVKVAPSHAQFNIEHCDKDELYFSLVRKLVLHPSVMSFGSQIAPKGKVQIMHLRTESDAIAHWCLQAFMTASQFKRALDKAYIDALRRYGNPGIPLLVLSNDRESPVLDFAREQGYKIIIPFKYSCDRELAALGDMSVAEQCSGVVMYLAALESSFSFLLLGRVSENGLRNNYVVYMVQMKELDTPVIYWNNERIKPPPLLRPM